MQTRRPKNQVVLDRNARISWQQEGGQNNTQIHPLHLRSLGLNAPLQDKWLQVVHPLDLDWARTQGYCKRGSGGQRKIEKFRATFWDSKLL